MLIQPLPKYFKLKAKKEYKLQKLFLSTKQKKKKMNKYSNSNKTELKILINIIGQCIAEVHMETLPYAYLVKD